MTEHTQAERWLDEAIAEEVRKHGTLLPPWLRYPDIHPYDLFWRMGAGESYVMMFGRWSERRSRDEWIAYLRAHAPIPSAWVEWAAACLDPDAEDEPTARLALLAEAALVDLDAWRRALEDDEGGG